MTPGVAIMHPQDPLAPTRRVGIPRRLGAPVDLYPNEWLHTAISRWAWHLFGVSRAALFEAFGLADIPWQAVEALGTRLLPEIAANISYATGLPEERLRGATMEALSGSLIELRGRGDGKWSSVVSTQGYWSSQSGTRFCPDCLTQRPGVFLVQWRTPWSFVCTEHDRVLLDACPTCQGEVVEMRGRETQPFDPSTCRANIEPTASKKRTSCRASLTDTWEHFRLDPTSAPWVTQRAIDVAASTPDARDLIALLQSAITALRGAKAYDLAGQLSQLDGSELRGLIDDEKHVGISAPKSAYAMAALAGAAMIVTHLDEPVANPIIRELTFSRPPARVPRGAGYSAGSPNELLTRWPLAPPSFRAQILRALDADLTLSQRLLWNTAVDPAALTARVPRRRLFEHSRTTPRSMHQRRREMPEVLWAAWCSRLDIGGDVQATALARALSLAVQLAGSGNRGNRDGSANVAETLRHNMIGTPDQTRKILAGIHELAHVLDTDGMPISYSARKDLPVSELLERAQWELLADSTGTDPGGARRHRNARRYLWQRLTASAPDSFPGDLRLGTSRDDSVQYNLFSMQMTRELQHALDRYGHALLRSYGIREPVTWAPHVDIDLHWPGPEILDLDVELLHTMLLDGVFIQRRLSESLRVPPRRITRAIDALPPSTGRTVKHLDWTGLRQARPDQTGRRAPNRHNGAAT